jgi:hypothetical protein
VPLGDVAALDHRLHLVRQVEQAQEVGHGDPAAADELYGVFEAPVRIRSGTRGGSIQIGFKDAAELRRLVDLLRSLG